MIIFFSELHGNISLSRTAGVISIKMVLNTESSEGLVVWHGNLSGTKKDFLAIAINDGYPTLTVTLGSGPNVVVGASRINDGLDHLVEVYIQGRTASIKVDHGAMTSVEAKGSLDHLEHLGSWHIGGLRDLDVETGGWFQKGFSGCIKSFFVQKKRINFQKDSVKTANLVIEFRSQLNGSFLGQMMCAGLFVQLNSGVKPMKETFLRLSFIYRIASSSQKKF